MGLSFFEESEYLKEGDRQKKREDSESWLVPERKQAGIYPSLILRIIYVMQNIELGR